MTVKLILHSKSKNNLTAQTNDLWLFKNVSSKLYCVCVYYLALNSLQGLICLKNTTNYSYKYDFNIYTTF